MVGKKGDLDADGGIQRQFPPHKIPLPRATCYVPFSNQTAAVYFVPRQRDRATVKRRIRCHTSTAQFYS